MFMAGKIPKEVCDVEVKENGELEVKSEHDCEFVVDPREGIEAPCHKCGWPYRYVAGYGAPTADQILLARARVHERSYGQAPQHVHVEQEVRAELTAITATVSEGTMRGLSDAAIKAILAAFSPVSALPAATSDEDLTTEGDGEE